MAAPAYTTFSRQLYISDQDDIIRISIMHYFYLSLAILSEVIATTVLKSSDGFRILLPTIVSLFFYAISFYFMSLCMRYISSGVIYAIWSGVGIVLISILAYFVYHQSLDLPAIIGIALIIAGVVVIKAFSRAV